MGNFLCPDNDVSSLASVARNVCPFPDYTPSPLFTNMMSINSSLHLRNHYTAVQSTLNPTQLENFTQSLRKTFGREGRVTQGGFGVVALSLAVLFDTLAKRARGEWVSDSGPVPGLFYKDLRGYYPPHVYTVSEYLRLVPHIANNVNRMREETERFLKRMKIEDQTLQTQILNSQFPLNEDITKLNIFMCTMFAAEGMKTYLNNGGTNNDELFSSSGVGAMEGNVTFNLHCDPKTADQEFWAEVLKSDNHIQEAFRKYMTDQHISLLQQAAQLDYTNSVLKLLPCATGVVDLYAVPIDFDLKVHALGTWGE